MDETFLLLYALHCDMTRAYVSNTATHRNTLQHTLQHTTTHCDTLQHAATSCNTLQHTATNCNTLQHTATHCNTLQQAFEVISYLHNFIDEETFVDDQGSNTATHLRPSLLQGSLTLHHTTTHCNTLQHAATHYNTL